MLNMNLTLVKDGYEGYELSDTDWSEKGEEIARILSEGLTSTSWNGFNSNHFHCNYHWSFDRDKPVTVKCEVKYGNVWVNFTGAYVEGIEVNFIYMDENGDLILQTKHPLNAEIQRLYKFEIV